MKIGLLVIATNNYVDFVPPLLNSMKQYFFAKNPEHTVTMFLFTNQDVKSNEIVVIPQKHLPWPGMTIRRYQIFYNNRDRLKEMDYLFYTDADMLFENYIGEEILGNLVVTRHCGYYGKKNTNFPYERNPKSTAFVPMNMGTYYFAGGFQGGKTQSYLEMSKILAENIIIDYDNHIEAIWHDESHWNKIFVLNKPSIILDPSYCFPRDAYWAQDNPFRDIRKLCALEKNHRKFQQ